MEEGRKRVTLRSFRDLEVYQRAQRVMAEVHKVVLTFPDHERYGLTDQMRRASKSVGGLIAEGWGIRESVKEFKHYLRRSRGSANEMESHIDTALVLQYIGRDVADTLTNEYRIVAGQLHQLAANWRPMPSPSSSFVPPPSPSNGGV